MALIGKVFWAETLMANKTLASDTAQDTLDS